jgi:hypothetical protein
MKKSNQMQFAVLKLTLFLAIAFCFAGCAKKDVQEQQAKSGLNISASQLNSPLPGAVCCWISTTNDADHKVDVYDPADNPWTATKWSWEPTTALGYNATSEIPLWSDPTDVKVRNNTVFGGTQVIIASSGRLATIASYPGGVKKWVCGFPTGVQLHGVEILPSGNCVIANADPAAGYIRIFSSSQAPPNHTASHIYSAPSAHAVLWDATHSCLWALSDTLKKYTVTGTLANPTLTLVSHYNLPTRWGHDLSAYTGDSNLMWVSTNLGTYIFNKTTGGFTSVPGAAQGQFVKGLSDQPGQNQIVESKQDNVGCTLNGWCTKVITFYDLTTGALVAQRGVSSAAFYKAKSFDPNYY